MVKEVYKVDNTGKGNASEAESIRFSVQEAEDGPAVNVVEGVSNIDSVGEVDENKNESEEKKNKRGR
ncbi:conserved hypothetical protein [Ricinus communis]|uniref:Uncharacterized protein n=1 Tax=Ricinus communis TaxID=3988 RepID=B9STE3_RICCO|nr:conserved hypothetical protein [Ricinus communis]